MTAEVRRRIVQLVRSGIEAGLEENEIAEDIAKMIDKELVEVLTKTMQFGELLKAVGLEIGPKVRP